VELRAKLPKGLLRFSTAGSVDDGKSTFIGRLLYDTGNIYDDHVDALKASAERKGEKKLPLALVTDGLRAEREQGITIDVAYRYFSTEKRRFILADSPGHEQYTRNMATAASTADLTVVLVDAQLGVLPQTKRHAFIAALLGVPRLLIAINKMDLVDYSESRFLELVDSFRPFLDKLGVTEVRFVPVVAIDGDNLVAKSERMSWYKGETVLEYLENVYIGADVNRVDLRFPVQYVLRDGRYRGYAGTIESGTLRVGEEVVAFPSERTATITSILLHGRDEVTECAAGDAVALSLSHEIDIARGSMLVRPLNVPKIASTFYAMLVWCSEEPLSPGARFVIRHTSQEVRARIVEIEYAIEVHDLRRKSKATLELNDIARVSIECQTPLFLDSYNRNRATGNFIIIDNITNRTVAAGMVLDRDALPAADFSRQSAKRTQPSDLHLPKQQVTPEARRRAWGLPPITLWCTGLSGSGKSTIAQAFETRMLQDGKGIVWLDGDVLRHGLNSDLSFSQKDRSENIRRTAEVARLLNASGALVISSLISPNEAQRELAREIIGPTGFVEVYVKASLDLCESRDPHGLYARARAGDVANFTGVHSAYEAPQNPRLILDTEKHSVDECVEQLLAVLRTIS